MAVPSSHVRLIDQLTILIQSVEERIPIAYCRIIETNGSTPQKAGALMLVRQDGLQLGTIGGGCVEEEVKSRARVALDQGTPEIALFRLNSEYAWANGLICGGRMKIAIEPVVQRAQLDYFQSCLNHLKTHQGGTEAIACVANSAPTFMFFSESRTLVAELRPNDAFSVDVVAENVRPLADRPPAYTAQSIAYLPVFRRCRLIIVGCGHLGLAVAQLASDLDFDVCAVDDRSDYASKERFPRAQEIIVGPIEYVLPKLEIEDHCYCLIVTRGHKHDEKALFHLVNRGARYVGLIGSRRKIKLVFEDLMERGISAESLAKVFAPVGIDIGSQTVSEIAVSIAAELVAHRNNGGVVPGRPEAVRMVGHE